MTSQAMSASNEGPHPSIPGDLRWKIRRVRNSLGWNRDRLGEATGKSGGTVSTYESGHREIPPDWVTAVAKATKTPLGWFEDGLATDPPSELLQVRGFLSPRSRIPRKNADVLTIEDEPDVSFTVIPSWGVVPAGAWAGPPSDPEMVSVDMDIDPDKHLQVTVAGTSMEPRLRHGQKVIIRRSSMPVDGVISLVRNQDRELTLKVTRYVEGQGWELRSINPEAPAITAEMMEVIGHAVAIRENDPNGIRA